MTVVDLVNGRIPDYYPTMYQDGYTPTEIIYANHKSMREKLLEMSDRQPMEVHITSEVKVK